ncbi:MAG: hypothetical protein OXT70_09390 [Chloroflexota bacterium]|nr:hypothetical protein [Chloroflexota bacterium]
MAEDTSGARLAYDIAFWRLREQIEYGRSLDSKLGSAFALSAAMIALLGSALIFAAPVNHTGVESAVISAASLFIANIVVSTAALLIGRSDIIPTPSAILSVATNEDEGVLWEGAAKELSAAERRSRGWVRTKSALVGAALLLTAATAISVAVAAILAV